MRASDNVLNQRRILTARRGSKSVSPPPSQECERAGVGEREKECERWTANGSASSVPRSPYRVNQSASGRKIVRAARVWGRANTRVATPTHEHDASCPKADFTKNFKHRPPSPCKTPPRSPLKNDSTNAPGITWERSMKSALACVVKNRSQATKRSSSPV